MWYHTSWCIPRDGKILNENSSTESTRLPTSIKLISSIFHISDIIILKMLNGFNIKSSNDDVNYGYIQQSKFWSENVNQLDQLWFPLSIWKIWKTKRWQKSIHSLPRSSHVLFIFPIPIPYPTISTTSAYFYYQNALISSPSSLFSKYNYFIPTSQIGVNEDTAKEKDIQLTCRCWWANEGTILILYWFLYMS